MEKITNNNNLVDECMYLHIKCKEFLIKKDFVNFQSYIVENFINNFDKIDGVTLINKLKTITLVSRTFSEVKVTYNICKEKYNELYKKL